MTLDPHAILSAAPFNLDADAIAWVEQSRAGLTQDEKIAQLFVLLSRGDGQAEADRLRDLQPGGITRIYGPDKDAELAALDRMQAEAKVPLLVSADLEGSRMSLPFGTEVPNPLALAAIDDVAVTERVSDIMAAEAVATGINWSFTPVVDINAMFRSPIVATRGFGDKVEVIERHALAQVRRFQKAGVAATVKHWPGEGHDDRDQHLVTTINPLTIAEWEQSHGLLYKAAVDAGVMSVMSAHIAFPEFVRSIDPDAGLEAYRPASVSSILNQTLLREKLGFNGLIVSDATPMAGFGAWAPRSVMVPECIENGCDIVLFSDDILADYQYMRDALADGRLSVARVEEALIRVLGLKAWSGLHKPAAKDRSILGQSAAEVAGFTAKAPTLVKDVQNILPLSPAKTKRVLVITTGVIVPFVPVPLPMDLPDLLRAEGFEVTVFDKDAPANPRDFDLVIYALAEETLLTRGRIFLDWLRLTGNMHHAMMRTWHEVPTMLISFGYPYYLYDAPRMPCVVNAYATMPSMQRAVVDSLLGRATFSGSSPIDPFCGLPDAQH